MSTFEIFTDKYLRSCGCSATKFPGMIYYKNQKLKWKVKSQKWKSYNVLFEEKEDGGVGEGLDGG